MQLLSVQPWESLLSHVDYSFSRYALGLVFILCQCIVWITAAVLTQYIYEENEYSPFLMTYIGMSLMAVFLPIEFWNEWRMRVRKESTRDTVIADVNIDSYTSFDSFEYEMKTVRTPYSFVNFITARTIDLANAEKQKRWNHKKHMFAALHITPAMFIADWALNAALRHTSVASATVIVTFQNVVVFLLAVLCRLEHFCWAKLAGVILSMLGIVLTGYHDSDGEASSDFALLGDLFAVIAALAYGTYTVQVRLFCPQNEELYKMQLLMGYIGLVVLVLQLPFAAYIMFIIRSDMTWTVLGIIVIKGFLDFTLTDYLLFRSIVLTSATVATVGLGLTIPMAFLSDCIFHPESVILSVYSVFGAVAIFAGFVIVSLSPDSVPHVCACGTPDSLCVCGSELEEEGQNQRSQEPPTNLLELRAVV